MWHLIHSPSLCVGSPTQRGIVGTPTLLFHSPNRDRFRLTSALNASKIRRKRLSEEQFPPRGRKCALPEATGPGFPDEPNRKAFFRHARERSCIRPQGSWPSARFNGTNSLETTWRNSWVHEFCSLYSRCFSFSCTPCRQVERPKS